MRWNPKAGSQTQNQLILNKLSLQESAFGRIITGYLQLDGAAAGLFICHIRKSESVLIDDCIQKFIQFFIRSVLMTFIRDIRQSQSHLLFEFCTIVYKKR